MAPVYMFGFFIFSLLVKLLLAANGEGNEHQEKCPPSFSCGYLNKIQFPFTIAKRNDCGIFPIRDCDDGGKKVKSIQLENHGRWFNVAFVGNSFPPAIMLRDDRLYGSLQSKSCEVFSNNYTLPASSPLASFQIPFNITMFRCNNTLNVSRPTLSLNYSCDKYDMYYFPQSSTSNEIPSSVRACSMIRLPIKDFPDAEDPFTFITGDILIHVRLSNDCTNCHQKNGRCQLDRKGKFHCTEAEEKKLDLKVRLGLAIGLPSILIIGLLILLIYKRIYAPSKVQFQSRSTYSDAYSNPDTEGGIFYFGVPLFSYKELEEATNNFDHARELGGGGFGKVYHGKLRDGREVAVKRLYEHNYRRLEQFMNEIVILTRLHHKNLVSLYGCTSCHSRELLLVYEYIPNGTVACHLHGHLANSGFLQWPIRMKIALETASALAYLHASDTIHRDVKTKNILIDNNYCVKVADFGLSRLFPNDVTHVSTAPQGTAGYLDPEYHQCFQLTSKSDVYSFGVVLIELISSMPAVDMNRHKDEISLANLAVKKIQKNAFCELVDPSLGFESDNEVKRMIISVAGLAFQCLQLDKELRPSMNEVLGVLQRIEKKMDWPEHMEEDYAHDAGMSSNSVQSTRSSSLDLDEVGLLKNLQLSSLPSTVTDKWTSEYTTRRVSS
ncbi:hypothetical protein L6164_001693 [Bauhinia variegata]|uniref:Uncharacterized protein n=1 Tax=Bauhinia variegata TaxID=167791 RepID=A0ACB9QAV9_BAUVA|nr:hypothetical protein L6164_001693 [Bauhinia variegata]